jgi:cell division protein ZapE
MSVIEKYRALATTGEVTPDPVQELAIEQLEIIAHRLTSYRPDKKRWLFGKAEPEPRGLYIFGPVGRGKSMLMDLFFEAAPLAQKRRVHFHAFMAEIHQAIFDWRQMDGSQRASIPGLSAAFVRESGDDPIRPVARQVANEATLLCFDEFQVEDVADAMILGRLFEAFFEYGVVIVATSNRAPNDLYLNGLNRQLFQPFIDLMSERMDLYQLGGAHDYRLNRLQGAAVYHTPLGPEATQALDETFLKLTDKPKGKPLDLDVLGRTVTIAQAAKGVARASFDDLCATALGAQDYLALCEAFDTLILDDIPQLGPEKRNEAKRFVTLIDTLYENHVRLVASAEVPPADLYSQGDGSFSFERTVSRLMEMQSESWLKER